ncbi:MAG: antitermination protein NusG [Deltaproteobacteria bacterium]|nr:MAG: antitermination protein NusG [Deltaproteobacteria bacterium]
MTQNSKPRTQYPQSWYAIYTKSRNEKKVYDRLKEAGIEAYLPLQKILKQWSDRKKWVEEPLFRSYLFVHITQEDYYKALSIIGVVKYITFEGKAVPVPEQQIQAIKQFLNNEEDLLLSNESFKIGNKVEIFRGALKGLMGNLVELKGKQKVKIEIESIGQSIVLTIPKSYLKVIKA